jgi:hypothetical protein
MTLICHKQIANRSRQFQQSILATARPPAAIDCRWRPGKRAAKSPQRAGWLALAIRLTVLTALAGLLILNHGCHGDEDNELFDSTASGAAVTP